MRKITAIALAFAVTALLAAPALWAKDLSLKGRVFDGESGKGIAAVTILLKATRSQGGKETVTSTNDDGDFAFKVPGGRFLLTASRGSVVLHRSVIEVDPDHLQVEIPLRRKGG